MKINTSKLQFLSKRTFTSKVMTKDEFQTKLYEKYELLYNLYKDYEIKLSDDIDITTLICSIADYLENNSYKYFEKLEDDLDIVGMGFDMMNWEDKNGQLGFNTLDNGFSYIGIYSSVGDDASAPIYNIFYFDKEYNLRAYCPYCGNLVFVGADTQMCVYGGYGNEERASCELFAEFGEKEPDDSEKYIGKFLELYCKKYGCIDEIEEACLEDLEFDVDLMEEDIKSNVLLC